MGDSVFVQVDTQTYAMLLAISRETGQEIEDIIKNAIREIYRKLAVRP